MTNFKKIINNLDVYTLTMMLYKSKCCPFTNKYCENCKFNIEDKHDFYNSLCLFPNNDIEMIYKYLISEVEDE